MDMDFMMLKLRNLGLNPQFHNTDWELKLVIDKCSDEALEFTKRIAAKVNTEIKVIER